MKGLPKFAQLFCLHSTVGKRCPHKPIDPLKGLLVERRDKSYELLKRVISSVPRSKLTDTEELARIDFQGFG